MKQESLPHSKTVSWGSYTDSIRSWRAQAEKFSLIHRIWEREAKIWTADPRGQKEIRQRLGWLDIAKRMRQQVDSLHQFAGEIKKAQFAHVVLLGMGGSSLAPEVFQAVFKNKPGFPALKVLDSTDPQQVLDTEKAIDLEKTLFIASSKSGGTVEMVSLLDYFYAKVKELRSDRAGEQFIAITDPGSSLEAGAQSRKFRKIFLADPTIGGRFSALSHFGLVPAALIGVDVAQLLERAIGMMQRTSPHMAPEENQALALGLGMAVLAEEGRDKLTLLTSPGLTAFGDWVEQLIAESTGKDEMGIVPVVREPLGGADTYSGDRFFVALVLEPEENEHFRQRLNELMEKGHPVVVFRLHEALDLGAEFFRWEMATAVACALLKINAFDQPDVQSAKDQTKAILKKMEEGKTVTAALSEPSALPAFFKNLKENDYLALLVFLPYTDFVREKLAELQSALREKTRKAVTVGFGPRYLHSTGQLHKGGPASGAYVLIRCNHKKELAVPNQKFTFDQLEFAQAAGDLEALKAKKRRLLHLALNSLSEDAVMKCFESLSEAAEPASS